MSQVENPTSNLVKGLQSERSLTKTLHKIAFPKSQLFITIMKYLRQVPNEEKSFIYEFKYTVPASSLVRMSSDPSITAGSNGCSLYRNKRSETEKNKNNLEVRLWLL